MKSQYTISIYVPLKFQLSSDSSTIPPRPNVAYTTWMVSFPASECRTLINTPEQPAWITLDKTSSIVIDKILLLKEVRKALRSYNSALPSNRCFDWHYLHCGAFLEAPLKLGEIDSLLKSNAELNHCHILITYDGSQGRGIRSSFCWERHLRSKNLPCIVTTTENPHSKQPLADCRKTLERYLTCPLKGYVDLNYASSSRFCISYTAKEKQYKSMKRLENKVADHSTVRAFAAKMDRPPISYRELVEMLESYVIPHKEQEHKNLTEWKEQWFQKLIYHQMLNHANKVLVNEKNFVAFKRTVSAIKVSHTVNWTWWDWLMDAALSPCTCRGEVTEFQIHEDEILQRDV